jgi:hypothetical protein
MGIGTFHDPESKPLINELRVEPQSSSVVWMRVLVRGAHGRNRRSLMLLIGTLHLNVIKDIDSHFTTREYERKEMSIASLFSST